MFFTVHFLVAVCKAIVEISGPSPLTMKLEGTLNLDRHTVNYAPMLAILFIWTWTHALQIDPKHGRFQRRAQVCFYGCTVPMCVQTFLIILIPFYAECECKEGDVVFVMKNQTLEAVVTANRYLALFGPYGGSTAMNYSVFLMPHSTDVNTLNAQIKTPKDSKDVDKIAPFDKEDVSTIYLVLFAAIFEKQFINLEVPGYVTSISNIAQKMVGEANWPPMTSVVSTILLKTMLLLVCFLVAKVLKKIQLNKIDEFGKVKKMGGGQTG
jgi:hypothetical protein